MINNRFHIILLFFALFSSVVAENPANNDDDKVVRENPIIDSDSLSDSLDIFSFSDYPFINVVADTICFNNEDWSRFSSAINNTDNKAVRILHIGDSHIQADMATSCTRHLFMDLLGSAGRGLISPLRLAGTNEPTDYSIKTESKYKSERLLDREQTMPLGLTGVSIIPESQDFDFDISAEESFERLCIYYSGASLNVTTVSTDSLQLMYSVFNYENCVEICLPFPCDNITVELSSFGKVAISGFELISDSVGSVYHAIGVNGATYASFGRIDDFGRKVSQLEPDLIVVSLGTNEAFGRFDADEFRYGLDKFVKDLQYNNPEASILLTTPAECQRRIGRGKKRRYEVNQRIADVRQSIIDYGRENNMSVLDLYEIAGGKGASNNWIKHNLMGRDRIHLTPAGYRLIGHLIFEAVDKSFNLSGE